MQPLIKTIENGFERRNQLGTTEQEADLSNAVKQAIALLDSGEVRIAKKKTAIGTSING